MSLAKVRMARTVQPDDFMDESLMNAERTSSLPIRLIYIALHTMADREGRFAWNSKTMRHLSLDDPAVIEASLDVLNRMGRITKYLAMGEYYGLIDSFVKTQHINPREKQSVLPAIRSGKIIRPEGGVKTSQVTSQQDMDDQAEVELLGNEEAKESNLDGDVIEVGKKRKASTGTQKSEFGGYLFKQIPSCGIWRYDVNGDITVVSTMEDISEVVAVFDVDGSAEVKRLGISELRVREYDALYPNGDNIARVKKSAMWIKDNPGKRKTPAGLSRFISSFVGRAQNNNELMLTGTSVSGFDKPAHTPPYYKKQNNDDRAREVAANFRSGGGIFGRKQEEKEVKESVAS